MRGIVGAVLAAAVMAAGAAHAVVIEVGSATGHPGGQVTIPVTLASEGGAVLATQNQIAFTRQAFIPAGADGAPDCTANPAIDKGATGFRFLPLGCDPAADCLSIRVFVLSFSNLEPIDDGAVLYSCTVQIAAGAPFGDYPLTVDELGASAAMGVLLPVTGTSGVVTAAEAPHPVAEVRIGSATGMPGAIVPVELRLAVLDEAAALAGVQADFTFEPATPVAARNNGTPDCVLGAAISQGVESFAFQPQGCTPGVDCSGVRAIVLSLSDDEPIPDGALLYTCNIAIGAAAAAGAYPLVAGPMLGSDLAAGPLLVLGIDGAVIVAEPPAPPCPGDCDGSGAVSINELLLGVNILLGNTPVEACTAVDGDASGTVTVSELIQAVNVALGACPA